MPVSAYLRAIALLICAAAALFASAGGFAITAFWIYLAILAAVFVAAFAMLDRGLLQERMRPGGRPTPLGLRLLNVVLLVHWVIAGFDRGRLHWSDTVPPLLQALGLSLLALGYGLVFWAMLVLFLGRAHSIRPRPTCGQRRAICLGPASRLQRRHPDCIGERDCAGLVARGRIPRRRRAAVSSLSRRQ